MTLLLFLSSLSEEKRNSVFAHSHVVYESLEQEARWEGFGVYTMCAAHLFTQLAESFVCIWFVMQRAEQRCDTIKTVLAVVAVRQGGH